MGLAVLLAVLIARKYYRIHASLCPEESWERAIHFVAMVLAPPVAVRAIDRLGRQLVGDMHPLAVAGILLRPSELASFGKQTALDLRYPTGAASEATVNGLLQRDTLDWFRRALLERVDRRLAEYGFELGELLRPPVQQEDTCLSYCPRCHRQYLVADGRCTECGLALVAFQESPGT